MSTYAPLPRACQPAQVRWAERLRATVARLVLAALNVRVHRTPAVTEALGRGGAVVVCNHASYLDGVLLAMASPARLVYTSETLYSRRTWWSRAGMRLLVSAGYGYVQPLDSRSPFGLRSCLGHLRAGRPVVIFPEGGISADSSPLPHQPGAQWLARRAGCRVVELRIEGAQRSRLFGKSGDRWWPRIDLHL